MDSAAFKISEAENGINQCHLAVLVSMKNLSATSRLPITFHPYISVLVFTGYASKRTI